MNVSGTKGNKIDSDAVRVFVLSTINRVFVHQLGYFERKDSHSHKIWIYFLLNLLLIDNFKSMGILCR